MVSREINPGGKVSFGVEVGLVVVEREWVGKKKLREDGRRMSRVQRIKGVRIQSAVRMGLREVKMGRRREMGDDDGLVGGESGWWMRSSLRNDSLLGVMSRLRVVGDDGVEVR